MTWFLSFGKDSDDPQGGRGSRRAEHVTVLVKSQCRAPKGAERVLGLGASRYFMKIDPYTYTSLE